MLTDLPKWTTEEQAARPLFIAAYACSVAIIVLIIAGQFALGLLFGAPALIFATLGHFKNPAGWGGTYAIGCAIGAVIGGLFLIAGLILAGKV
jgi:hypothetical protein